MFAKISDQESKKSSKTAFESLDAYDDPLLDSKFDKQNSSEKTTPEAKTSPFKSSIKKSTIFIIIGLVAVVVIGIIIFVIIRNCKTEVANVQKELDLYKENEESMKQKIESYTNQIQNMDSVIKQQQLQMNTYKADLSEYENKFTDFKNPKNNGLNIPSYEMDEEYDESNPGMHARKPDPRLNEREQIKTMINQKRETIEDKQAETRNKIEVIDEKANKNIQKELKNIVQQDDITDSSDDENDQIFSALEGGGLVE